MGLCEREHPHLFTRQHSLSVTDKTCLLYKCCDQFWRILTISGICNSPYVVSFLTSAILLCYQKRVLVETILKIVTQRLYIFFLINAFLGKAVKCILSEWKRGSFSVLDNLIYNFLKLFFLLTIPAFKIMFCF